MPRRLDGMVIEARAPFAVVMAALVAMLGTNASRAEHPDAVDAAPTIDLDLTYGTVSHEAPSLNLTAEELDAVIRAWCARARQRHPASAAC